MKHEREKIERVEKALITAYRSQEEHRAGPGFEQSVMRHVLGHPRPAAPAQPGPSWGFGGMVWRFATAVLLLACLLGAYTATTGLDAPPEVAQLYIDDSADLAIVHILGIL